MTDMADNPAQPRAAHRRQLRGASRYLQFETWEAGIVLVGTEIKATCARHSLGALGKDSGRRCTQALGFRRSRPGDPLPADRRPADRRL